MFVAGQGKIAPLLQEEFAANMIQNKFNHNGFVVNHTCAGTYYSSYSQQMIRSDCTATGYGSNNQSQPSPFTSNIFLSLLDFTKTPTLNTYFEMDNLVNKTKCSTYSTQWLPPPQATFLRDVHAAYAGEELTAEYGRCEKWSFVLAELPRTVFTFYFDSFSNFVRYDFTAFSDPEQELRISFTMSPRETRIFCRQLFLQDLESVLTALPAIHLSLGTE